MDDAPAADIAFESAPAEAPAPAQVAAEMSGDEVYNTACAACHTAGIAGAPIVTHEGMPDILLSAKCRSCHVQIRTTEATADW